MQTKDYYFIHPERKIQLLNGNILDCYPIEQQVDAIDNELHLDMTGEYLAFGKPKHRSKQKKKMDGPMREELKLFLDNAHFLMANRDSILSNSRMFLCSIPIQSGLAYTGTSGFNHPTLGIYLEWWGSCEIALHQEENGSKWLLYHIAGSPLSGANKCGLVDVNGRTKSESVSSFRSVWSSFMRINTRYDDAKTKYEAYTLQQVIDILRLSSSL